MADNVDANPGSGGAKFQTALLTWSGDSAHSAGTFNGILTGSEGAWTYNLIAGGAGAVTAGVQRVTLASDDPLVALMVTADASLSVLDDWDETDRCKVNLIAGQAGIAAGAGAVGATVPRFTLASDDPAVASLSVMDDWDESDRCKVNLVAGVAGLNAGAGTVGTGTLRMTLASDDPAVAVLGATTGAAVVTDADGTIQRYLRGIVKLLITTGTIVLGAGTAAIGKLAANVGVYIGDVGHGKTIKTVSGVLTADTDIIAAVTSKRIKVFAYSMFDTGTNANAMIFKSNGTSGTELWRLMLQGASGSPMGANLAVSPPGFLFATVAGEKLTLDVGDADSTSYSISYWDDDAT